MLQLIKKTALLYIILTITFTVSLCLSYCLPTDSIKKNVATSALQIEEEGIWWKPFGFYLFQIDNMTDCIMLGTSSCNHGNSILQRALLAERSTPKSDDVTDFYHKITSITYQDATDFHTTPYSYSNYARYWHGYQIFLKPLLCFFNYQQIRVINYFALFLLAIAVIYFLYKRTGNLIALTFAITLTISNFFIVPLAFQFSICFYLAFLGMILLLSDNKWLTHSTNNLALTFFCIGACTSYFDLLTTPLITLAFPIIALLTDSRRIILPKSFALICLSWGMGYALLWATKWLIARIFTDYNIIEDAIQAAELRMGNTLYFGGKEMSFNKFLEIIINQIQSIIPMYIIYFALLIFIIGFIILIRKFYPLLKNEKLIVCILFAPLVWFLVLKNHSIQHIFFTWRNWIITLWCILILIIKSKQYKKVNNENRNTNSLL